MRRFILNNSPIHGRQMVKTVIQSATFKGATPQRLYATYLSSAKHAAAIGAPAQVEPRVGGKFQAFGMLKGKFLVLIKDKMIVQTWRAVKFKKHDEDSILTLRFDKVKGGARIQIVHAFVPDHDYADIQKGWPKYYWKPWAKYLRAGDI